MLAAIEKRTQADPVATPRYAVGVSLGGSVLLNWLGRAGRNAAPLISAAAAVSAPLDLVASGLAIDRGSNRVYSYALLSTLRPKSFAMAERFPGQLDLERLRCARTMYEFDEAVTAPLHGFSGTHDYRSRASSRPWLRQIGIPTLVLNARNDPLIPAASLPRQDEVAPHVLLEQPKTGGHVGFPSRPFPGDLGWLPRRLAQFSCTPPKYPFDLRGFAMSLPPGDFKGESANRLSLGSGSGQKSPARHRSRVHL